MPGKRGRRGLVLTTEQENELIDARKRARRAKELAYDTRLRAVLLVGRDGSSAVQAAQACEVHPRIVEKWLSWYREGGVERLRPRVAPGKVPRLTPVQKAELALAIDDGPESCGFDTGVWTGPLVAELIENRFGVSYSVSQVRRILHELEFSLQYPRTKLSKASHLAQQTWLNDTLPEIKKKWVRKTGS